MFAKTSKCLSRLNKLFKDGKVQKYYWAITKNKPEKPKDTLIHWLRKMKKLINQHTSKKKQQKPRKQCFTIRFKKA